MTILILIFLGKVIFETNQMTKKRRKLLSMQKIKIYYLIVLRHRPDIFLVNKESCKDELGNNDSKQDDKRHKSENICYLPL